MNCTHFCETNNKHVWTLYLPIIFKTFTIIMQKWNKIKVRVITFEFIYLRKKSNKNDFPCLKAPATEITTTYLSLISSCISTLCKEFSSNLKLWPSLATTIGTAWGLPEVFPALVTSKKHRKHLNKESQ